MDTENVRSTNNVGNESALVPPVPSCWPPAWLVELEQEADHADRYSGGEQIGHADRLHGWRLPNGVVVCATCRPCPDGAVAVRLVDGECGPAWVESEQAAALPDAPPPQEPTAALVALRGNAVAPPVAHNPPQNPAGDQGRSESQNAPQLAWF